MLAFPRRQNQAEAHYKGNKHARKVKAVEAQKNRQRHPAEQDKSREKVPATEAPTALMDTGKRSKAKR